MQIRPYKPGDEQLIQEFDWLLFPDPWNKRNLRNWFWRYKGNNPAGDSIIYLMEHEGKIISHFAIIPYRIRVFGEDMLASHSIGAMVAPEYQGKGLIKFVADKLFAEVEKKKIMFSYGFPNNLAYELHKKIMAYGDIAQIYTMEKQVAANRGIKDSQPSKDIIFRPIIKFDHAADELWAAGQDIYKISVIRNAAYLNWRFLERPDQRYFAFGSYEGDKLVGYVILKLYRDEKLFKGHIVDMFSWPGREDVARVLIEESQDFFAQHRTDVESTWVTGSELYTDILLKKGYKPVNPRPLICRLNLDKDKLKPVLDQRNWYFTMGDTTEIY